MLDNQYIVRHYDYPDGNDVYAKKVRRIEGAEAERARERASKWNAENLVRARARKAALRVARKTQGLCHCGATPEEGYKTCRGCIDLVIRRRVAKPETDEQAEKRRRRASAYAKDAYAANPTRFKEQRRRYLERKPHADREKSLKSKYGLSLAQWNELLRCQHGRCANCGSDSAGAPQWHTDHDHETGAVRGILCRACNHLLGLLGDDIRGVEKNVARLLDYLTVTAAKTAAIIAELKSRPPPESDP